MKMQTVRQPVLILLLLILSGCAGMVADSFMRPAITNLQRQTDVELVCEGTPALLLMLDSMIASEPGNRDLLITATKAFSGYAAALDACNKPQRASIVSVKARRYGLALLWPDTDIHAISTLPLPDLHSRLAGLSVSDVDALFWAGNGWVSWIQYQHGSPASLAQLVRVEQIMLRVLELDEGYYHGAAHLFLGAYYGSKPPLLGGNPEKSRLHFERALELGSREYLPGLVLYAETYARMSFDRELFSSLLQEVLDFPLESRPDLGLANQLAKRSAGKLLGEIEEYF